MVILTILTSTFLLGGRAGVLSNDSAWISSLALVPLAGRKAVLDFKDISFGRVRTARDSGVVWTTRKGGMVRETESSGLLDQTG